MRAVRTETTRPTVTFTESKMLFRASVAAGAAGQIICVKCQPSSAKPEPWRACFTLPANVHATAPQMAHNAVARRRLGALEAHVAHVAPAESSRLQQAGGQECATPTTVGAAAAGTAAKLVLGAGGAALAGHVGYEWRKHGLAESWRKSLERKGSAFALTEAGRWLGIRSGLLHFSAVVRQKRMMAAPDADEVEIAGAVGDMHTWFYETTGELNDPKKKQQQTSAAYAEAHPPEEKVAADGDSGSADTPPPPPLPQYTIADVAEHTEKDDCWVVIRGKVYDVSSWLASHPGGPSILLKLAGGDATDMFTAVRARPTPACIRRVRPRTD
jgi:hypothetical protein